MISAANAEARVRMGNRQPNSTSIRAFAHAVVRNSIGSSTRPTARVRIGSPPFTNIRNRFSPHWHAGRSQRTDTAVHGIVEVTALGGPGWAMDRACISSFQIPNSVNKKSRTLQIYNPRSHSRY